MIRAILVAILVLATASATFAAELTGRETGAIEALKAFKDWSNYLLVTTTVALGWVANDKGNSGGGSAGRHRVLLASAWFLCLSIIFGIFTLALVPIVLEQIPDRVLEQIPSRTGRSMGRSISIFEINVRFGFIPFVKLTPTGGVNIKDFCWIQHLFFLLGVLSYTWSKAGWWPSDSSPSKLETENARLRKAIGDLTLDKQILQEAARGNFSAPRGDAPVSSTSGPG
jgi:hypothetical protein